MHFDLDLRARRVTFNGQTSAHMTGQQIRLLGILHASGAKPISKHGIAVALWGEKTAANIDITKRLATQLCRLRDILEPLGLVIENDRLQGWRVIERVAAPLEPDGRLPLIGLKVTRDMKARLDADARAAGVNTAQMVRQIVASHYGIEAPVVSRGNHTPHRRGA